VEHCTTAGGLLQYGLAQLDISDEMDVRLDRERYDADRQACAPDALQSVKPFRFELNTEMLQ
jgi:hypothetical protein